MKKIAFFSTIFPIKDEYLEDFFYSLKNQTIKNFDLIIVNDNYKYLSKFKNKYSSLNIIEIEGTNNIARNRELGINYAIDNNYEILIFGDSDDYFENNRIETSIILLNDNDIVVNDLTLFNKDKILEKKYLSNRLKNLDNINYDFIKNKNLFGLSNTAINIKNIKNIKIPNNINVVDWYLFTILLSENRKAIFTNNTITYYRQYENNLIGLKEITLESYKKGIEVKKIHYANLLNIKNINKAFLEKEIIRLTNLKKDIIDRKKIESPLWWELI